MALSNTAGLTGDTPGLAPNFRRGKRSSTGGFCYCTCTKVSRWGGAHRNQNTLQSHAELLDDLCRSMADPEGRREQLMARGPRLGGPGGCRRFLRVPASPACSTAPSEVPGNEEIPVPGDGVSLPAAQREGLRVLGDSEPPPHPPPGRAADPRQGPAAWKAKDDLATRFHSPGKLSREGEGRNVVRVLAGAPARALTAGLG